MRVAYVCTDPGVPVFGRKGCSIHVQAVLREMVAAGCEVTLVARRFDGELPADLYSIRVCELKSIKTRVTADREQLLSAANRELRIELERAQPFDLVYERYSLWSNAAMQFAAVNGVASILEINAPLVREQATHRELIDRELAVELSHNALQLAQVRLAVSAGVANQIRADFELSADEQIDVVPNGVTPERFAAARRQVGHRLNHVDASNSFVVGFVGTLRPWHGLTTLGAAFTELHHRVPSAKLLIVGDGHAREELEAELSPAARDATIITGALQHDGVPLWMAQMDVAVAPYPKSDGFYFSPLKVLEYFATGLPVVCSSASTFGGLVNEFNAMFFDAGDSANLAAVLQRLHDDLGQRRRLARTAFESLTHEQTWTGVWQRAIDLAGIGRQAPARSAG